MPDTVQMHPTQPPTQPPASRLHPQAARPTRPSGWICAAWLMLCWSLWLPVAAQAADALRVGSKRFTESYILAHVLAQTAQAAQPGLQVDVRQGLGNTAIVFAALKAGDIDVYADYTGTIDQEILKNKSPAALAVLREQLRPLGLGVDVPLGFNNGYALAMRDDVATRLGINKLSDLARHPTLRLGLSNEFIGRADGWKGLAPRYGLAQQPSGLDHGLAYDALVGGQTDAIDIYTTDAQIGHLKLRVLQDDLGYFPRYDAVLLYRLDVPQRFALSWAALQGLRGSLNEPTMIALNARAELQSVPFEVIAREHLAGRSVAASATSATPPARAAGLGFWAQLWAPDLPRLLWQHLRLVLSAVGVAALIGVPLAMAVAARPAARSLLLGAAGVMQTVPALALLAVLISLLGRIGIWPALVALTLYALLPIVQNTCTGLAEVPAGLKLAAKALGLSAWQRLRLIELPLALPVILAGLRTATTIAVGTATIAAFIGAGGLGERIVTGLALNDKGLMLAGALPAAALALMFEALFGLAVWALARRGGN